jgi:beta-lactamase superfamily II metal-dependent hydrolase
MEELNISKKQIILILTFSFFIFFGYFLFQNLDSKTKIVFCDVGQGDATYIRVKNKVDVLIDAGPDRKILTCLGKYMPFWDKKIELAFLSHPNKDHYQGFFFINNRYKIDKLITTEGPFVSQTYKKLINELKKNNVLILKKFQGDQINILNDRFLFLWPVKDYFSSQDNDYSHLLLFQEDHFKALFTGDASPKILNLIVKTNTIDFIKNINLLKIPHHGSKNGLTKNFLSISNPKIAVISVGKNNTYGHPAKEVLEMLKAQKVKIKRTDEEGNIVFKLTR